MSFPQTIPDLVDAAAERFERRPILREIATGRSWTYGDLLARSGALADRLAGHGAAPGVRVGIVGDNGPEWTAAYLSIVRCGATAVPLDPTEDPARLLEHLRAARAAGVLVGRRLARPGEPEAPARPEVAVDGFCLDLLDDRTFEGGAWRGGSRCTAGTTASLLFTSGSTGRPRSVPLTHANLLAEYDGLSRLVGLSPEDRTLALVPFHHVLGFNVAWMLSLGHGIETGFLPELTREALSEALRTMAPTAVCAVPAVWTAMREGIESRIRSGRAVVRRLYPWMRRTGRSLGPRTSRALFARVHRALGGSLRIVVTSGAPFPEDEVAFWKDLGLEVLHAYGLTETSGALTCTGIGDPADAGVGRPLAGVDVRIVGVGPDGVGEITARGGVVMAGYEGATDDGGAAGATELRDGWIRTGDLGRIDRRGFLHVLGRRREVIVTRGGETVYPEPVEEHLQGAAYVSEVAVVGSGPPGDERPVAVVVPDQDAMRRDGIVDVFGAVRYSLLARAAALPAGQRPADYRIFPGPLPRTATRKLRRVELRARLESGERGWGPETMVDRRRERRGPPDLGDDPEARAVAEALAGLLRPGAPWPAAPHLLGPDLGLDSLDRVTLVAAVESRLGHRLPEDAVRAATVADLIAAAGRSVAGDTLDLFGALDPGGSDDEFPELIEAERTARRLRWTRRGLAGLFRAFGRTAFRVRAEGIEHLPGRGPFLLCSNHQSYLDPYFLLPVLPREVRERMWVFAVDWLFRGPVSSLYLHTARTLPMDNRHGRFLHGLRMAARVLDRGEAALIFPEGMRSFDGRVGPWRPGAGLVALRTGVPIVPAAVAGVYQILPPGRTVPSLTDERGRRRCIRIAFGEPVQPPRLEPGEDPASAAQRIVDGVRERTLEMLDRFPAEVTTHLTEARGA